MECLTLARNQGKGAAVLAGFGRAAERGFSHALQVDADGQHDLTMYLRCSSWPSSILHLISGLPVSTPRCRRTFLWALPHPRPGVDPRPCRSAQGQHVWLPGLSLAPSLTLTRQDTSAGAWISTRTSWCACTGPAPRACSCRPEVRYPRRRHLPFPHAAPTTCAWPGCTCACSSACCRASPRLIYRNLTREHRRHWAHIGERGSLAAACASSAFWIARWAGRRPRHPLSGHRVFLPHPSARTACLTPVPGGGRRHGLRSARASSHFMQFSLSILDKVAAWYDPARIPVEFPERAGAVPGSGRRTRRAAPERASRQPGTGPGPLHPHPRPQSTRWCTPAMPRR